MRKKKMSNWLDMIRKKESIEQSVIHPLDPTAPKILDEEKEQKKATPDLSIEKEEVALEEIRPKNWGLEAKVVMRKFVDAKGAKLNIPVKVFTDTSRILETGNHIFIIGTTGKGKTVLLLGLDFMLYNKGFNIIHRDDGGLESLLLAPMIKDFHIWVPRKMTFQTMNWRPPNPVDYFDPLDPKKLVQSLLTTKGFHTILFDAYSLFGEATVKFWGPFYREFIFQLQQIPPHKRTLRVLSADELHDIVQPARHSLTREHSQARGLIELNIRKLRKFGIKVIGSAHRPNQLPINIRSQFAYYIFKQCYPADAYSMLNQQLAHIPSKLFWIVLSDVVHRLRVNQFYLFDDRGHFDKYTNVDLPRYLELLSPKEKKKKINIGLKTSIKGSVDDLFSPVDQQDGKFYDLADLVIFRRRCAIKKGKYWATYDRLAEELNLSKSTIHQRVIKMKRIEKLELMLKGIEN